MNQLAFTLIVHGSHLLPHGHTTIVFLSSRLLLLVIAISDELLLAGLLCHTLLLLLHGARLHLLLLFLSLALGFLLSDALTLFLLTTAFGFLLLATALLLLLFFPLFLFTLLCFGSSSLLSGLILVFLLIVRGCGTTFVTSTSKDSLNVRGSIYASSGCLEHCLEESVGLFWLLTGDDLRWFDLEFLSDDQLGKLDQLDKEVDFSLL